VISLAMGVLLSFDIPSRSAMVASIVPKEHLAGAIAMCSAVASELAHIAEVRYSLADRR
jgi:hypothetical protein